MFHLWGHRIATIPQREKIACWREGRAVIHTKAPGNCLLSPPIHALPFVGKLGSVWGLLESVPQGVKLPAGKKGKKSKVPKKRRSNTDTHFLNLTFITFLTFYVFHRCFLHEERGHQTSNVTGKMPYFSAQNLTFSGRSNPCGNTKERRNCA